MQKIIISKPDDALYFLEKKIEKYMIQKEIITPLLPNKLFFLVWILFLLVHTFFVENVVFLS